MIDLNEYGLDYFCKVQEINPVGSYNIQWVDARQFITPNRIDLIAKIKYVEAYDRNLKTDFFKELYKRNIDACTNGTFSENGNDKKNSFQDFLSTFHQLIEEIKTNGFDASKSIIPVNEDGEMMDGAHRVSICAYYGLKIPIIRFPIKSTAMDVNFFRKRVVAEDDLSYMMSELCKWRNDIFFCCIWPSAGMEGDKREKAVRYLKKHSVIIDHKQIRISNNGIQNLIPQIYIGKEWVGSINNGFASAAPKIEACIGKKCNQLDAVLFLFDEDLNQLRKHKERMRDFFGIKENSLHITDNAMETIQLVRLLFQKESFKELNLSNPFKYRKLNRRIYDFSDNIRRNNFQPEDFIIDSSTVMGLYGIREPDDLDFLSSQADVGVLENDEIHDHREEAKYYDQSIDDLIYNPGNHFYYFNMKIITLQVCKNFKKRRGESKDRQDVQMIKNRIENSGCLQTAFYRMEQFVRRKTRNQYIKMLNFIKRHMSERVFCVTRKVYHSIIDIKKERENI